MPATNRPITETPNQLTSDIDVAEPIEIVRLLRSADAQIFGGFGGHPGLSDIESIEKLARLADVAARILRKPAGRVIMSGAGTSGRLAMFVARTFNRLFATPENPKPFRYTIAGTDLALIAAQEGAEDDPHTGAADLAKAAEGASDVFYIGITCGLSAPYIAGQIESFLTDNTSGHAVLLGFNPEKFARDAEVEGWNSTFKQVLERAQNFENFTLLNPVVGPEPITGSTRMKSGSATKVLLETLFCAANAVGVDEEVDPEERLLALAYVIRVLYGEYEAAIREAYLPTKDIARVIELAGQALNTGGRIFYLGNTSALTVAGGCGHDHDDEEHDHEHMPDAKFYSDGGVLGLIDASECPPTYGARFEDVRGYLENGWEGLLGPGSDYSEQGPHYRVSLEDFRNDALPTLNKKDLVVFLGSFDGRDDLVEASHGQEAQTASIFIPQTGTPPAVWNEIAIAPPLTSITFEVEGEPTLFAGPPQLAIKLILNAITTGGYILNGKVFGNRMIDLRISNNKLYYRAIGIISDLMGVDEDEARNALFKSIYQTDTITDAMKDAAVRDHIEASKSVAKLVPTALLLATGKYYLKQATDALASEPVVRNIISEHVK